jgi:hypothetical protein
MKVHLCAAVFKEYRHSDNQNALAMISAPGLCDVICLLVLKDGKLVRHEGDVWDYRIEVLAPVIVQSGAATFEL